MWLFFVHNRRLRPLDSVDSVVVQYVANALFSASTLLLLALALHITYVAAQFYDFSLGGILVVGGIVCVVLCNDIGVPFLAAAAYAVVVGGALSLSVDGLVYAPLRGKKASSLVSLLSSLGVLAVVEGAVSLLVGDGPRAAVTLLATSQLGLFGASLTPLQAASVAAAVLVAILVWGAVARTRWGLDLRAVSSDAELAALVGVEVERTIARARFLAGGLAALAGSLVAADSSIAGSIGLRSILLAAAAMLAGAKWGVVGVGLASVGLSLLQHGATLLLPSEWTDAIVGLVILGFLAARRRPHLTVSRARA